MQKYETEEQQIEALKKWLRDNGTSLIIGVGLGVAGLFGWREYAETRTTHGAAASDIYFSVAQEAAAGKSGTDDMLEKIDRLTSDYTDTPYAPLAVLALAKSEYDNSNTEQAINRLDWVIANATSDEIRHVARLRLARIHTEAKNFTAAEQLLATQHPAAFDARYEEHRGDLFVAMGDTDAARLAYDRAIASAGTAASQWLQLKRQDLGQSEADNSIDDDVEKDADDKTTVLPPA